MFDGKSASEIHWEALGRRCDKCQGPPVLEVLLAAPEDELVKKMPKRALQLVMANGGALPAITLRGPGGEPRRFIVALHTFACAAHRKELEHLAAGAPSSYHVELRRGPPASADRRVVQVRA
jgi:hypothetical protein